MALYNTLTISFVPTFKITDFIHQHANQAGIASRPQKKTSPQTLFVNTLMKIKSEKTKYNVFFDHSMEWMRI
jgi:hypothetical protein